MDRRRVNFDPEESCCLSFFYFKYLYIYVYIYIYLFIFFLQESSSAIGTKQTATNMSSWPRWWTSPVAPASRNSLSGTNGFWTNLSFWSHIYLWPKQHHPPRWVSFCSCKYIIGPRTWSQMKQMSMLNSKMSLLLIWLTTQDIYSIQCIVIIS